MKTTLNDGPYKMFLDLPRGSHSNIPFKLKIRRNGIWICTGDRTAESVIFEEPVLLKYKEVGIRLKKRSFEQGMTPANISKE